jgi:hypothetical protein
MKLKIALSSLAILLTPVIVFFILELAVRFFAIGPLSIGKAEVAAHQCEAKTSNSYRLFVEESQQKKTKFTQNQFVQKNLIKNHDFFATNEQGYVFHKENQNFRQQARVQETNEILYDVNYSFGEGGRRRVPEAEGRLAQTHLAISGCSVVFGQGLEDEQTLPALVQRDFRETKVYNLGRVGGSVVDSITTLQNTNMWKGIAPSQGILLFYHAQHTHIPRFLGSMSIIGAWKGQAAFLKESSESGDFSFGGVYYRDKLAWTWLSEWAVKSELLKMVGFDWPPQTDSALDSYARALVFLRKEYRRLTSQDNPMVVYLAPGDKESCKIIPFLEKYEIYYLDYTSWHPAEYAMAPLTIQYDGHPTEEFNKILAKKLTQDLKSQKNQEKMNRKLF